MTETSRIDSTTEGDDAAYDAALERFLHYGPVFGGGLSNHGPMALEALASQGFGDLYGPFVNHYVDRLEPADNRGFVDGEWRDELAAELPELVAIGASQAGHGLLRVAHATRAIGRRDTPARRRELAAAMAYWRSGHPLTGPERLTGSRKLGEVVADLPRLDSGPEGFLTKPLARSLRRPDVMDLLSQIEAAEDPAARFDELALLAAGAMAVNRGLPAFGLLHGVTVTTMARELLAHLDEDGVRLLEARMVTFVVAAVVGLDRSFEDENEGEVGAVGAATGPGDDGSTVDQLVRRLAAGLDDHDIKFADAAAGLHRRTGSGLVLDALRARLVADF